MMIIIKIMLFTFQGLVAAEWAPVAPSTYKYSPKSGFTFVGSSNVLGTYECSVPAVGTKAEISLVVKGSSGRHVKTNF